MRRSVLTYLQEGSKERDRIGRGRRVDEKRRR